MFIQDDISETRRDKSIDFIVEVFCFWSLIFNESHCIMKCQIKAEGMRNVEVVGGFCPFGRDRNNSLQTNSRESRLFCVIVCLELTCDGRTYCHGNGAREKDDAYW
jgi:hypothetical protein